MNLSKLYRLKYFYDTVKRQPGISKKEIMEKVNAHLFRFWGSGKEGISDSTFKRDRIEVEDLFNVRITSKNKGYQIEGNLYGDDSSVLLETLGLYLLSKTKPDSLKYIRFAPRKIWDVEYFFEIITAISNNNKISFAYTHHENKNTKVYLVSPIGLKEFKGFWYLVCQHDKQIKTFGMDRISDLNECIENSIAPKNFDLNEYYKDCFGLVRFPDDEPQEIIIKMKPIKYAYYKKNPLHHSQQVIEENPEYVVISLFVYFTYDLKQELRSHVKGEVELLQPNIDLHSNTDERYY